MSLTFLFLTEGFSYSFLSLNSCTSLDFCTLFFKILRADSMSFSFFTSIIIIIYIITQ